MSPSSLTFQAHSAPYPWFVRAANPPGGVSEMPAQLFLAGSASGVTVTLAGMTVLSTVRTAAFQIPHTMFGGIPDPPCCQSPARLEVPLTVTSVMNRAGHSGRPPPAATSLPVWSPLAIDVPTCGLLTEVGEVGVGVTG